MDQYSYLQSHIGPYNNYMDPGLNDKTNENNKLYFMGAQQPPPQQGHQQIMQPQAQQHQQLDGSGPVLGTPEVPFHPNMGMVHNSQVPMYHQNYGNPYIPYVPEQVPYGPMHQNPASVIQMPQNPTIPSMPLMSDNIVLPSPQGMGLSDAYPLIPQNLVPVLSNNPIVEPIVVNEQKIVESLSTIAHQIQEKSFEPVPQLISEMETVKTQNFTDHHVEPALETSSKNAESLLNVPKESNEHVQDASQINLEQKVSNIQPIAEPTEKRSIPGTSRILQEPEEPPIEISESPPQSITSDSSSTSPVPSSDESAPQYSNKKKRKRIRLLNEDDSDDDDMPESERLELLRSRSPEPVQEENVTNDNEPSDAPKSIFHNVVVIPADSGPTDCKRKKIRVLDSDDEEEDVELKDIGLDGENVEDLNQADFLMNENVDGGLESIDIGQIGEIVPLENPIVYSGDEDKDSENEDDDDDEDDEEMYVKEIDDDNESVDGEAREIDDDAKSADSGHEDYAKSIDSENEDDAKSVGSDGEDNERSDNSEPKDDVRSDREDYAKSVGSNREDDVKSISSNRGDDAKSVGSNREDDAKSFGSNLEDDARSVGSNSEDDARSLGSNRENDVRSVGSETIKDTEDKQDDDGDELSDVEVVRPEQDANQAIGLSDGEDNSDADRSADDNEDNCNYDSEANEDNQASDNEVQSEADESDNGDVRNKESDRKSNENNEEVTKKDKNTVEKDTDKIEKDTEITKDDEKNDDQIDEIEKDVELGEKEIEKEKDSQNETVEKDEENQDEDKDDQAESAEKDEDEDNDESDSDVIVQEIPDDEVQEILDSEEEQQLGENKKTDEGELHDASVNYLASAELEDLPLSVRLKQERQVRKQQRRAERRQMRRNEMMMRKKKKNRPFDLNEDLNNPFGISYSSSSTDEEDIPNEIYFGTPDRVAMSYSYKGRGRPKSRKHRSYSSSEDEDYYKRKHSSMRYMPSMGSKKKRKRDRFYDKSRDIPNDIYFNANVPLHVLHSFGASSDSDEPKAVSKYTPSYSSNRKPYPKYSSKPSSSSSSHYKRIDVTAHPPSERINQLKEYLKIAGLKKVKFAKIWEGCKTNDERAEAILKVFRRKGMIGEPTAAKCRELKLKLQTRREIAELDTSVIIDSEEGGRTRRSAKKPEATEQINTEGIETLNKMKQIVDSDSD